MGEDDGGHAAGGIDGRGLGRDQAARLAGGTGFKKLDRQRLAGQPLGRQVDGDAEGVVDEDVGRYLDRGDGDVARLGGIAHADGMDGDLPRPGVSADHVRRLAAVEPAVAEDDDGGDGPTGLRLDCLAHRPADVGGRRVGLAQPGIEGVIVVGRRRRLVRLRGGRCGFVGGLETAVADHLSDGQQPVAELVEFYRVLGGQLLEQALDARRDFVAVERGAFAACQGQARRRVGEYGGGQLRSGCRGRRDARQSGRQGRRPVGLALLGVTVAQAHAGRRVHEQDRAGLNLAVDVRRDDRFKPDDGEDAEHRAAQHGQQGPRPPGGTHPPLPPVEQPDELHDQEPEQNRGDRGPALGQRGELEPALDRVRRQDEPVAGHAAAPRHKALRSRPAPKYHARPCSSNRTASRAIQIIGHNSRRACSSRRTSRSAAVR